MLDRGWRPGEDPDESTLHAMLEQMGLTWQENMRWC